MFFGKKRECQNVKLKTGKELVRKEKKRKSSRDWNAKRERNNCWRK